MRKYTKVIAAAGVLAALAVPTAATAATSTATGGGTVSYNGNGFSAAGVLNTDDPTLEQDGAKDGYLLWVLGANGATSATLNGLPGGPHTMIAKNNTFKFESDYFSPALLKSVTATYEGAVKGNVVLTVSHGHAVDSNVPSGVNWTPGTGGTVPVTDQMGDSPEFAYKTTQDRHYTWESSLDNTYESVQHLVFTWNVDAEPIYGDVTGELVGYELTETLEAGPGENYRTGTEQGTCPDGGYRTTWLLNGSPTPYMIPSVDNIASGLIVNGEWLPNTV